MAIMGSPDWAYKQVWENIHDAIELLANVKAQLPELEESNATVNEIIYPMLVEASMKLSHCSRFVSALSEESNDI